MIPKVLEDIMAAFEPAGQKTVMSAFECAAIHLAMRTRGNNHPFIEHPLGVAEIVVKELGLGAEAVTAVLLHEANRFETEKISELNHTALMESFRSKYSKDILDIVTGLNNIAGITLQQTNLDPERYRKLIVSYSTDPRVVLIKIADRLEVMRNIRILPAAKQKTKTAETMMLYTPLAHQLGLYQIKNEFEDIYLRLYDPDSYRYISAKLKEFEKKSVKLQNDFVNPLKEKLSNSGIEYHLKARTKSPYSIWKKMQAKNLPFEEIYDVYAMRFIIECDGDHSKEEELCWKVYSLVTEEYVPDTSRLRDWISKPKENGYESLHTTVQTKDGYFVEVQIRTQRMDFIAEQGHAAHWSYKGVKSSREGFTQWLNNLRNLMQSSEKEKYEQSSLMLDEILVFTPTGDLRQLRSGATVLDFAFEIHSNLGLKCSGARVNGKIASIREKLHSGDVVDIISNKNQKPNADWLNFVVSSKAKSKIKQKLKEEENKRAAIGKELLDRRLKNWKLAMSDEQLANLVKTLKFKTINEFFGAIGEGSVDPAAVKEFLTQDKVSQQAAEGRQEHAQTQQKKPKLDARLKDFDYKTAKCCNPTYGDEVFGFLTIRDGIKIHKQSCPNAARLKENFPYRILEIEWKKPTENAEKGDTHKGRKSK
ncbi:MAG: bifunctional (p)ppGpp synthetase/guanosine-3',5'-bis(diphosphate) 3'-pyrophosphohydrolase [Bacteroidales bacterium]|nr:bifunctional (p)ppGpp synthetase/guanosine-3',5'-bis(diphosphate) 3'-pyrophosphohydrolase [Candidatus Cacconaster equi]